MRHTEYRCRLCSFEATLGEGEEGLSNSFSVHSLLQATAYRRRDDLDMPERFMPRRRPPLVSSLIFLWTWRERGTHDRAMRWMWNRVTLD